MHEIPRTKVEIVDPMQDPEGNYLIKPREIRINGTPVCIAKDSLLIEYDQKDQPVRVSIEILPDELVFRRADNGDKEIPF